MSKYRVVMHGGLESTVEANNIQDFYQCLFQSGIERNQIKELWIKLTVVPLVRLGEDDE